MVSPLAVVPDSLHFIHTHTRAVIYVAILINATTCLESMHVSYIFFTLFKAYFRMLCITK